MNSVTEKKIIKEKKSFHFFQKSIVAYMSSLYDIFQHKPIVQNVLSLLSNRDAFRLFRVSAQLRRMWYIQYEKIKSCHPFELRVQQIQNAREWRKVLDLEKRLFEMTGVLVDIYTYDPMKKMRTLIRQKRPVKRLKINGFITL